MLHLQATMHFPGKRTRMRSGDWAQIHLCWVVWLGSGVEEDPVSLRLLRSAAGQ
jgi:hypothetical protein